MAGDEEHEAVAARHRSVELAVDRPPGAVEAQSVKIDDPVRRDATGAETLVPAAVEAGPDPATLLFDGSRRFGSAPYNLRRFGRRFRSLNIVLVTR